MFERGKQNKTKKLIKSIKLYLQEIQVIHSVRKKAFKAHSKNMYSKMLKGEFLPPCTVHKACNFFFFMNS